MNCLLKAAFAFYGTGADPYTFSEAASNTFAEARASMLDLVGCLQTLLPLFYSPGFLSDCAPLLKEAMIELVRLSTDSHGRTQLSKAFKLCTPLKTENEALDVINWAASGLIGMAMLDYPFPSNYGISLPGKGAYGYLWTTI